jgi:large subunit ribosomal protein L35
MAKKQKFEDAQGRRRSGSRRAAPGRSCAGSAFKRHILTSKSTKVKRHLRGSKVVTPGDARKINLMLPYK